MTFGSLFAGIGGFDLGLERAGMQCKWQVEIDDYATKVLEKHWPNVKRYRDVREAGPELERVDLICGGFPCQDLSVAGDREGIVEGTRSGLWLEFARIIREVGPGWVLVENVVGLLSANAGRDMGRVLGDLAALGFDAEWQMFSAEAFGAEHRRERIFIVAHNLRAGLEGWGPDRANAKDARVFKSGARPAIGTAFEGLGKLGATRWSGNLHGIPRKMDRIRCLGNAVVPQVAEWIGRRIMEAAQ